MPVVGAGHYQYVNSVRPEQPQNLGYADSSLGNIYGQRPAAPSAFPIYSASMPSNQMSAPHTDAMMTQQRFGPQQPPMAPQFSPVSGQPATSMAGLVDVMQQNVQTNPQRAIQNPFGGNPFDSHDLSQYNFDPASFNFGNHYGALEFGMLGHMSSGAVQTPPSDSASHSAGQLGQNNGVNYTPPATLSTPYSDSPINAQAYMSSQDQNISDWRNATQSNVRQSGPHPVLNLSSRTQDSSNGRLKQETPNAFSIGAGGSNFASPTSSSPQVLMSGFDESPVTTSIYLSGAGNSSNSNNSRPSTQGALPPPRVSQPTVSTVSTAVLAGQMRRRRDPSAIYESVTQPYSYTAGFHSLTAFLQRRFSPQKTLRIAKSLASIRPSFISCTKSLNRDDLIFMEKCFQRTLWEYEDFINACGTPTIVCRRTGEVAAVGKEFSILTGWRKDVLLGREANLNINTGGTSGGPGTGVSSRAGGTPRMAPEMLDPSRPQPVFLAELLDDDSVIEFYEDFARMAFGDSRGSVTTRCKLLKYRSKTDGPFPADDADNAEDARTAQTKSRRANRMQGKNEIAGEAGIDELADKDGKVDCSCCWTVKRDLFDIPMSMLLFPDQLGFPLIRPLSSDCNERKFIRSLGQPCSSWTNQTIYSFFLVYSWHH